MQLDNVIPNMWASLKADCRNGIISLEVVEEQSDGSHEIRRVDTDIATDEIVERLTARAETFASCGVPALLFHIKEWGPKIENCVTYSRYFAAMPG